MHACPLIGGNIKEIFSFSLSLSFEKINRRRVFTSVWMIL